MSPSIFSPVTPSASETAPVYRITDLGHEAIAIAKFQTPWFVITALFSLCEHGATLAEALEMGMIRHLSDGTRDLGFDKHFAILKPAAHQFIPALIEQGCLQIIGCERDGVIRYYKTKQPRGWRPAAKP